MKCSTLHIFNQDKWTVCRIYLKNESKWLLKRNMICQNSIKYFSFKKENSYNKWLSYYFIVCFCDLVSLFCLPQAWAWHFIFHSFISLFFLSFYSFTSRILSKLSWPTFRLRIVKRLITSGTSSQRILSQSPTAAPLQLHFNCPQETQKT